MSCADGLQQRSSGRKHDEDDPPVLRQGQIRCVWCYLRILHTRYSKALAPCCCSAILGPSVPTPPWAAGDAPCWLLGIDSAACLVTRHLTQRFARTRTHQLSSLCVDRALVAGTVAKDLWDDHGIWLVENGVIDESSANALKIYLESVPYHMRSSAGGRGVAILAPDTFVCTKNNLVPGQADVIVDHFARG